MDDGVPRRWTWRDNLRWAAVIAAVIVLAAVLAATFRGHRSVAWVGLYILIGGAATVVLGAVASGGASFGETTKLRPDVDFQMGTSASMGFARISLVLLISGLLALVAGVAVSLVGTQM